MRKGGEKRFSSLESVRAGLISAERFLSSRCCLTCHACPEVGLPSTPAACERHCPSLRIPPTESRRPHNRGLAVCPGLYFL